MSHSTDEDTGSGEVQGLTQGQSIKGLAFQVLLSWLLDNKTPTSLGLQGQTSAVRMNAKSTPLVVLYCVVVVCLPLSHEIPRRKGRSV